jgi:hypothetical protein
MCEKIQNPCDDINTQINSTSYKNVYEELKNKTSLQQEAGYVQNKDGNFDALSSSNNGHQLIIPTGQNRIGYIHTHINNFPTGKNDPVTGAPIINKITRMLSLADVNTFIILLKNARTTGYPVSNIFGTMISSSGTYTIRFTGNTDILANIKTNYTKEEFRILNKIYNDIYIKDWGRERGFLKYLKHHLQVTGISLYKIKSSGRIRPLTLNATTEKLERNDCE